MCTCKHRVSPLCLSSTPALKVTGSPLRIVTVTALDVFDLCPIQSLCLQPSALRVCVSGGGPVWLSITVENQNHINTCLSVSHMENSGTHDTYKHIAGEQPLLSLIMMCVVSQPSPVLWRDHLLLVCGPGRTGGSWNPIARCCQTCMWGDLFTVFVRVVKCGCAVLKELFSVQLCPRPSLSCSAHRASIAPPRCNPTAKRWPDIAVCSGAKNRGAASQRDETRCNQGQNTADSARKTWMD